MQVIGEDKTGDRVTVSQFVQKYVQFVKMDKYDMVALLGNQNIKYDRKIIIGKCVLKVKIINFSLIRKNETQKPEKRPN